LTGNTDEEASKRASLLYEGVGFMRLDDFDKFEKFVKYLTKIGICLDESY